MDFNNVNDEERQFCSMLYIELRRTYDKVFYHHNEKEECDLVLSKGDKVVNAIQICFRDPESADRKQCVQRLLNTMSTFNLKEGYIFTKNESKDLIYDGKVVHLVLASKLNQL
jgi:predicted AAA+ superfamily ATPase